MYDGTGLSGKKFRSKLEERYAAYLELRVHAKEILGYAYEPLRLRLADGTYYKPDFLVWFPDGTIAIHEVKGFWREAAKVRFRVAKDRHPWFTFVVVERKGREGWTLTG